MDKLKEMIEIMFDQYVAQNIVDRVEEMLKKEYKDKFIGCLILIADFQYVIDNMNNHNIKPTVKSVIYLGDWYHHGKYSKEETEMRKSLHLSHADYRELQQDIQHDLTKYHCCSTCRIFIMS